MIPINSGGHEDVAFDPRPISLASPTISPVREALRVVRRHLGLIVVIAVVTTAAGAAITFSFSKRYTADAVVAVREAATDPLASPDAPAPRLDETATDTVVVMLKSKDLAEQVVEQVGYAKAVPPVPFWRAKLCQAVAGLNADWLADYCAPPVERTLNERADLFAGDLSVEPMGRSRAVALKLTAPTRAAATDALNTLISTEQNRERNREVAQMSQVANWLEGRSAELRNKWLQAENKVSAFRVSNGLTQTSANGTSQPLILQQLSNAATALSQSQADLASATARAASLQQAMHGDQRGLVRMTEQPVIAAGAVALQALYSQQAKLSQQFGPNYPELASIRRQISQAEGALNVQINQTLQSVRNELTEKQAQTDFLARSLDTLRAQSSKMDSREVQATTLEGEAKGARLSYETFLSHAQRLSDRSDIQQPIITLVSSARAGFAPSFPNVPRFLLASGLIGLALGIGVAFAREHLRTGFTEIGRVSAALSLPLIATLPVVKSSNWRNRKNKLAAYVAREPTSQAAEAARSIATSIALKAGDGTSQVVSITSATTQEGKSITSLWLANVVAEAGNSVLVIDCDHRAGTVTASLGGRNGPGLSSLLHGDADIEDVVQRDMDTGIHFIPADRVTGNFTRPPDIDRLRAVLQRLKRFYKLIIIDTPPLMATSNALLYCSAADQTVFICRWRSTGRDAVHASIERLRVARARLTGLVLSMVDPKNEVLYNTTMARRDQLMLRRYYGS